MKPYYEDDGITIYHADCREVLPMADVLVTDPPFNVGKDYGASDDDLPLPDYEDMMQRLADDGPVIQAWVTPTNRLAMFARLLGDEAKPVVIRRGAVGPKRWGWLDQFDMLLVRGRPLRIERNLWTDIRLKGEGYFFRENTFGHPGYTPSRILERTVGLFASATPGWKVVDPFCGTGGTLIAAKKHGLLAIGIEIEERYCEIAAKRLSQGVLALEAAV